MPSGYDNLSTQQFEDARAAMIERVNRQWLSWDFNMWKTYHSTVSDTWKDPWHEYETHTLTAPDSDPDHKIAQNLYGCYCYFSWREYNTYAMIAVLGSACQESTITGAAWEGGYHPYQSLTAYDPTGAALLWYAGDGSLPAAYTVSATDTYTGITYTKAALAGTWDAIHHYTALLTYQETDPDDPSITYTRVTLVNGNPVWDPNSMTGWRGHGQGYGFCQFTPYSKLRTLANMKYGTEGERNWQLNLTLDLDCIEWQREQYRTGQYPSLTEWIASGYNSNDQPGFYYPNTLIYETFDINSNPISWDDYVNGVRWYDWVIGKLNAMETPPTGEDRDWCIRQVALSIWRCCYIKTVYNDNVHMKEKTLWVKTAIDYWDANGGPNVLHIPRCRDITQTELDKYHLNPVLFYPVTRRRKQKYVRSVLL